MPGKPRSTMNVILNRSALLALGALTLARLGAAVESVKIEPTFAPTFSSVLLNRGITDGKAILAVSISAEGKLTDWLALEYTDREIVDYFVDALKSWDITPAKIDGQPVAAQIELVASVSAQGVVISRTGTEMLEDYVRRFSARAVKHPRSTAHDLDRAPARLSVVTPKYAEAAAKQGVAGKVQVRFYIDEHGTVRMPAVEPGAHPYLADEAVAAVREWKFEPPTSHGKPVLVAASQEFNFSAGK